MVKLSKNGETIVEVLFAIAVVASAIGGAFAISSRSSNTIQANQERYQAQLIANSQADGLRIYESNNLTFTPNAYFCMNNSSIVAGDGTYTNPSNPSNVPHGCMQSNGSNQNLYTIYIKALNSGSVDENIFMITVQWDSLLGGKDQVELLYGT